LTGLTRDTYHELVDRKIIWVFAVVTVITLGLTVLGGMAADNIRIQAGGSAGSEQMVNQTIESQLAGGLDMFLWFIMWIAILGVAGVIPTMLEKGRAEYYLAKPLSRARLLTGKLLGLWLVYGGIMVLCALLLISVWAIMFSVFNLGNLWVIAGSLLEFGVMLAILGLVGVLSGSFAFSLIAVFFLWVAQKLLMHRDLVYKLTNNQAVELILDSLYYVTPKFSQHEDLFVALANRTTIESWLPLWTTALFGAVAYVAAISLFKKKDY
jgi:ABC-type transport system involved in multi-copper enzyme maturation permease subunit